MLSLKDASDCDVKVVLLLTLFKFRGLEVLRSQLISSLESLAGVLNLPASWLALGVAPEVLRADIETLEVEEAWSR